MKLTQKQIEKMKNLGANRWTKYGKDRLYLGNVDVEALGFEVDYYNTGNIKNAKVDGEKISNSKMGKIFSTYVEAYIDLQTGEFEDIDAWNYDFMVERFENLIETLK